MKITIFIAGIIMLAVRLPLISSAATDNIYTLSEITPAPTWEGTNGNRLQASSTYGDERIVTFHLPWDFIFYGQTYTVGTPVTLDTNGNIWFASNITTSAHNFGLDTTAGRGPVIAAWNDDLSSAYYGGVFVQHKSDLPLGERVVVEWQAETQADEGLFVPNSFETILFQDGRIRTDYQSIKTTQGADTGSGISKGANGTYLSVTSNYAQIPAMTATSPRSFLYTPIPATVNVTINGSGSGSVSFSPSNSACNSNCSENFLRSQQVTLTPAASPYSLFTGWTVGACTEFATTPCVLTLSADATTTATFDKDTAHQVYVNGVYYSTIQAAYDAAVDGSTVKLWATDYTETVTCGSNKTIMFDGGYDSAYSSVVGPIILNGSLTIKDGKVIANGLTIR